MRMIRKVWSVLAEYCALLSNTETFIRKSVYWNDIECLLNTIDTLQYFGFKEKMLCQVNFKYKQIMIFIQQFLPIKIGLT